MTDALAQDLVASFDALFGGDPGVRAAHAKGICCAATFTATREAAALTRAPHMQGEPVRATVRFSNGSGVLTASDIGREPRGMAAKFHLDERKATDLVAVTQSVFVVRTPEEFVEFMRLRVPDPESGQLDIGALAAFVAERPESQRAVEFLLGALPIAGFLQARYFAMHAFRFVDAGGNGRFGRYRWEPDLGVQTLEVADAKARGREYLREDLLDRLERGPASFRLHITLARDGDDPTDPTVEWDAEGRDEIVAGALTVTHPLPDQDAGCESLVFDPVRLCDGIEASDDPILHARPGAYAISSRRRSKAAPRTR